MRIRIRDWEKNFERDRSKQWKHLQWVPLPNRQGAGYRKIMAHLNGAEIFGCWVALVEVASTCEPRGDLSKYNDESLTLLSMIRQDVLMPAIRFLSQELDWIEVIENLDSSVNNSSKCALETAAGSSILSNSVLSNSVQKEGCGGKDSKSWIIDPVRYTAFTKSWPFPFVSVPDIENEWNKACGLFAPDQILEQLGYAKTYWEKSKTGAQFIGSPINWLRSKIGLNYKAMTSQIRLGGKRPIEERMKDWK